ncbi:PHT1-6, partial [Symbiodinium microadriaticum]
TEREVVLYSGGQRESQCLSLLIVYFFGDLVLRGLAFDWIVGAAAIVVALSVQVFTLAGQRRKEAPMRSEHFFPALTLPALAKVSAEKASFHQGPLGAMVHEPDTSSQVTTEDNAASSQMRSTLIAAFSNLSTAYNLVNINVSHVILEDQYCGGDNCKGSVAATSSACLAGAIFGQLTFGYIGDCLGRGPALYLTMVLSIAGALVSAFAVPLSPNNPTSVFVFLSVARFVLGAGVGGVYPLAATVAAEGSDASTRGRSVALVFSMQGIGQLLVPIVSMAIVYNIGTYDDRVASHKPLPGISWRLILGLGALPGLLLLPFQKSPRVQQPESSETSEEQQDAAPPPGLLQALRNPRHWRNILGCAGGWFLFDITFYGNTLFSPTVLKDVWDVEGSVPVVGPTLKDNLCWQMTILALIGLPGYYMSVWLMDKWGRKNIQVQGFAFMAVLYAVLAIWMEPMEDYPATLLLVYGLTYFFSNFGPNSTTFILPSETFPTEVRSTLNGFCAACGKLGAVVGSSMFKPLVGAFGTQFVFYCCAACAGVGIILTAFCVDDRRGHDMVGDSEVALTGARQDPINEASGARQ